MIRGSIGANLERFSSRCILVSAPLCKSNRSRSRRWIEKSANKWCELFAERLRATHGLTLLKLEVVIEGCECCVSRLSGIDVVIRVVVGVALVRLSEGGCRMSDCIFAVIGGAADV
jgi:hypothetical protein